jgi:hypothetical protein
MHGMYELLMLYLCIAWTYIHTRIYAQLYTHIHTHIRTCMHTHTPLSNGSFTGNAYMHAYIRTYIHTHPHACIHTHTSIRWILHRKRVQETCFGGRANVLTSAFDLNFDSVNAIGQPRECHLARELTVVCMYVYLCMYVCLHAFMCVCMPLDSPDNVTWPVS